MSGERGFGFLQMDSPFMRFLSTLADLMLLNILTILCCIPVITAGASFAAMHYVLTKMVRNEEGYIVKGFFKAFKQNLVQGIFLGIGLIAVAAALYADLFLILSDGGQATGVMRILLAVAAIVIYLIALYIFPVLSRYHNTIRGILKTSFSMAVIGLFSLRTVFNGVLFLAPFLVLWFVGLDSVPFLAVFCFSLPGYLRAMLYNGLFKQFEASPEEAAEQAEEEKKKRGAKKADRNRFH